MSEPRPGPERSSSEVEARLAAAGFHVPDVAAPVADYVPALTVGQQVWTSGQLPMVSGELAARGKVGAEVSVEQATELARTCCLNAIAAVKAQIGDLDRVTRVVKLTGYIASAPDFTGQPGVLNGASSLLGLAFGDAGRHARSAVGVAVLPLDAPVEADLVVEFAAS